MRIYKFSKVFVLATLCVTSAMAQQKIVPAQSEIAFTSQQMGVPVEGKFRKFDARIAFDPKKPEASKINFAIDLDSAQFSAAGTEAELSKPEWFNTKLFPQATFQSTTVKATGAGKFEVSGKLWIKGSSRDVVVPVVLSQTAGITVVTGTFIIRRLDFKIGDGDWKDVSMVANDVQVRIKLGLSGVTL